MSERRNISLLIVDDNADLAQLLELTLRQHEDVTVLGTLPSADSLVEAILEQRPDVVLIDLTMGGKPPLDAVREAGDRCPDARAVVYSGFDDAATVERALDAGAWGFVSKHQNLEELVTVVRRVARGEVVTGRRH